MPEAVVSTPEQPVSQPTAQPTGQPSAPAQPSKPVFTYQEKRDDWIQPDKYRAAERATTLATREVERLRSEIADRDRKIAAALAGVAPRNPQEAEADEVRKALFAILPPALAKLAQLPQERLEKMLALADNGEQILSTATQAERRFWDRERDRTLGAAYEKLADRLGAAELPERMRRKVDALFVEMSARNADAVDPENGPYNTAFLQRYEQGDPTLIDELVKEIEEDFLQPARRLATVPIVQRRPVPRDGGSRLPVTTAEPKEKATGDPDKFAARLFKALKERREQATG